MDKSVDKQLLNWASWLRRSTYCHGYPARSSIIATGGISGIDAFEHLCAEADLHAAIVTDQLIADLPAKEQAAVKHHYTGTIYKFDDLEKYFDAAIEILAKKMPAKGLA